MFAGIPFGAVRALAAVWIMNMAMGFMVILGITSLIGVIATHVVVLFDFIEERHAYGEPLRDALIDAGILRIRPVLITVGATVLALFPLALHGGPLWEALCYAQIGGLTLVTTVTLFIVPVLYSIFVLDLQIVELGKPASCSSRGGTSMRLWRTAFSCHSSDFRLAGSQRTARFHTGTRAADERVNGALLRRTGTE